MSMNDSEIKSNNDSIADDKILPLNVEEIAKIDELLKSTADECSAQIDFERIKQRALASDKKRRRRRRLLERISLAVAACLMVVGFGAIIKAVLPPASAMPDSNGQSAFNPPEEPAEPSKSPDKEFNSPGTGYISCVYIGSAENVSDSVKRVSDVFRNELPTYMDKRHDEKTDEFTAKGTDDYGHYKYCDCSVVSAPPYKLELGQLGKMPVPGEQDSENYEFFWQIKKDVCLKISFLGFNENEAQALMDRLAREYF